MPTPEKNLLENVKRFGSKSLLKSVWDVFVPQLVVLYWQLRSLWQLGSWWEWRLNHLRYQMIYTNFFGFQEKVNIQWFSFKGYQITRVNSMTIWKTIDIFYQFYLELSLFNLLNSVCRDWSLGLRLFCLFDGVQHFFVLFPQESLFRDIRHSDHSSVFGGWNELPSAQYPKVFNSW